MCCRWLALVLVLLTLAPALAAERAVEVRDLPVRRQPLVLRGAGGSRPFRAKDESLETPCRPHLLRAGFRPGVRRPPPTTHHGLTILGE